MTDALDRLKNKHRPTVPPRDTSIAPTPILGSVDTSISRNQDIKISKSQDTERIETQKPTPQEVQSSEASELITKQTTMRLEEGISDRLQDLCRGHGISREVLIESMFLQCEADRKLLETVLFHAVLRNQQRLEVANRKRAQTMMEKFGQG